jgi:hypothetical protein
MNGMIMEGILRWLKRGLKPRASNYGFLPAFGWLYKYELENFCTTISEKPMVTQGASKTPRARCFESQDKFATICIPLSSAHRFSSSPEPRWPWPFCSTMTEFGPIPRVAAHSSNVGNNIFCVCGRKYCNVRSLRWYGLHRVILYFAHKTRPTLGIVAPEASDM